MMHYFWVFVEKFGAVTLRVIAIMLLSRLLAPEDFGVFAMVAVIVSIGATLVDSGMGGALVRQPEIKDIDYSTVFVFNLILSALLCLAIFICAPFLADFYSNNDVQSLAQVLSIVLIIKAFSLIQITRLTKELRFKLQAIVYLGSFAFSMVLAVILAFRGWGYWSLAVQQLVEALITTFLFVMIVRYFPGLRFSFVRFRELFLFGFTLTVSSLLKVLYQNSVVVIFGRLFSVGTVGLYGQANKINDIYTNTISAIIEKASYPVLVKKLENHQSFVDEALKLLDVVVLVCFPVAILISICSELIVLLLMGHAWIESAWMLELIVFSGLGMTVEAATRSVLKSLGLAGLILKLEILKRGVSIFVLLAVSAFGVKAVLLAFVGCSIFSGLLNLVAVVRVLNEISFKSLIPVAISTFSAAFSYSVVLFSRQFIDYSPIADCILLSMVMVSVYALSIVFFRPYLLRHVFDRLVKWRRYLCVRG